MQSRIVWTVWVGESRVEIGKILEKFLRAGFPDRETLLSLGV